MKNSASESNTRGAIEGPPGRIAQHARGSGTVTQKMVEKRARELAMIDGRDQVAENDRDTARSELLGTVSHAAEAPEEAVKTTTWDEAPGSSGHQVKNLLPKDDQTLEKLVEEGVEEAEHDQMVEERKTSRRNDRA